MNVVQRHGKMRQGNGERKERGGAGLEFGGTKMRKPDTPNTAEGREALTGLQVAGATKPHGEKTQEGGEIGGT